MGVAGATGATGSKAQRGPSVRQGRLEPWVRPVSPGLLWTGAWGEATQYTAGAIVSLNGSDYVALQTNVGASPAVSPSDWTLLAQVGATGATGLAGAAGSTGAVGATGATGSAGVTGRRVPSARPVSPAPPASLG